MRLLLAALLLGAAPALADSAAPQGGPVSRIGSTGPAVYQGVCQSCHMADARGASGAATIPALAGDVKIDGHDYPISVVLYGYGAMPAMGGLLSDDQIAAVLSFVRSHFGNAFDDPVRAAEVRAARVPGREYAGGQ